MKTAYLLASAGRKRDHIAPARVLYDESWTHRAAVALADHDRADVYILSAKYGLLAAQEYIEPYDLTLTGKGKKARQYWCDTLVMPRLQHFTEHCFVVLAGQNYLLPNMLERMTAYGNTASLPLKGLRLGAQRVWYKNALYDRNICL